MSPRKMEILSERSKSFLFSKSFRSFEEWASVFSSDSFSRSDAFRFSFSVLISDRGTKELPQEYSFRLSSWFICNLRSFSCSQPILGAVVDSFLGNLQQNW